MFKLTGKAALVTGAGSGIGEAIARAFAAAGANVVCADVQGAAAKHIADAITSGGGRAIAVTCDVSSTADAAKDLRTGLNAVRRSAYSRQFCSSASRRRTGYRG